MFDLQFDFAWPWVLLLLPLPWLAAAWLPAALRSAPLHLPPGLQLPACSDEAGSPHPHPLALVLWALLLLALAGPRWLGPAVPNEGQGRDLMLAIDLSGSMAQQDLVRSLHGPNRLQVVQELLSPFIERRQGDRMGLILFGSKAYLQAPLTYDLGTIDRFMGEAEINLAGGKTAIGDAIGLAIKELKARPAETRVLILLTDGSQTTGNLTPLQAAELAAEQNVRIYSIGIGAAPRQQGLWRIDPASDLDEATLGQIAEISGGRYFRAYSRDDLQAIYQELDQLEPSRMETAFVYLEKPLYPWPLGLALLISFIWCAWHLRPRAEEDKGATL